MSTTMDFLIADTFTDSLAKLTGQEQKSVKTAAFDLQMNPAHPSLQFHRVENSKDPNFWSVRVNLDLRIIIHKTAGSFLLCYVGHHDDAYNWGQRRKIEQHPRTGAIQIVEVRERVEEISTYRDPIKEVSGPPELSLFAKFPDDELLDYGVPAEWIGDVKSATESTLFDLAEHLPQEAAEALLELATGGTPQKPKTEVGGFDHPDTQRRIRLVTGEAELALALEYPWEKWTVFLHPSQRSVVERNFNGPARVSGSAGTGKTVVALHRAVFLAKKHLGARILLTTFSEALATLLQIKLERLIDPESETAKRITVQSLQQVATELAEGEMEGEEMVSDERLGDLIAYSAKQAGETQYPARFLEIEWNEVVDPWQLSDWDSYRDVPRLGRKTRLGVKQREALWQVFERVRDSLHERNLTTWPTILRKITSKIASGAIPRPFDIVVVDEAQDLGVPEIRFLVALTGGKPDSLFLAGDLGQRIFQQPFSWKAVGIDIRGRSHTLRVNYRTSHQIRLHADRLLPESVSDVDGNAESRKGTVSVFNGPLPEVRIFDGIDAEIEGVAQVLLDWTAEKLLPDELGIFVRSEAQLARARAALKDAGLGWVELERNSRPVRGKVSLSTMHLAKGLEFRAAIVMACDDEVLPLQDRVETVADEADLEEVYTTERHLLYVACTRARDRLLVCGVDPESEFLGDLGL
ncbi:3'-5' exonuclease [Luteolibacter sp. Y139]|uniref:DNA 3'-5' helicase n=2 Tax=Luteolibacter soli TaxID=3135280 RepID=A0ABU9ARW0_9BACT